MKRNPIQKRKLSDTVRDRLLAELRDGRMPPGTLLPSERELMETLGVGRPAIREAMQSLQSLGLIIVRHGERPRVAEPQLDLLAEQLALTMRHVLTYDPFVLAQLKEARVLLEVEVARRAAQNKSDEQVDALRKLLSEQDSHLESKGEFTRLDGAFHVKIGEMSGNLLLASVVKAIFDWLEEFHTESVRFSGLEELTVEEHKVILDAIALGDPQKSAEAMERHLLRANSLYQQDAHAAVRKDDGTSKRQTDSDPADRESQ